MSSFLVVVDGSAGAGLALERAIELASALPASEIVLLHVRQELPRWQAIRAQEAHLEEITQRILAQAREKTRAAGIRTRTLAVVGDTADAVSRIAEREACDHIFVPQKGASRAARAIMMLTGLSTDTEASRIISLSGVPVTVFAATDDGQKR